jgi:hypothetical protein
MEKEKEKELIHFLGDPIKFKEALKQFIKENKEGLERLGKS